MPALLDRWIPRPDVRSRYDVTVQAPAELVLEVARNFDMNSIRLVRVIFRLRAWLLGARYETRHAGLVEWMQELGWVRVGEQPGRFFVASAACQPWLPNVVFTPVAPEAFVDYAEPDRVKIVWTLEAEPLGPAETRFATETRVTATDENARLEFRRYWRKFRMGIVLIRRLLLPAVRREAERRWRIARAEPPFQSAA